MIKPIANETINTDAIIREAKAYMKYMDSKDFHQDRLDDYENDIFEAVMLAVYDSGVFDYINSKIV